MACLKSQDDKIVCYTKNGETGGIKSLLLQISCYRSFSF